MRSYLVVLLSISCCCIGIVMGDLNGFKECQKRFGFSKKVKQLQEQNISLNGNDGDVIIEELDGYLERQEEDEQAGIISSSLIDQELSNFYHCLSRYSNCQQLIDTKPVKKDYVSSIPYKQCFENCYNPNYYSISLMKEVVEFSLNCARTNLNIDVEFSADDSKADLNNNNNNSSENNRMKTLGKRQPWGVLIFGVVISTLFVGWVNVDRIKKKLSIKKKHSEENNDLVEIYELNPDYLARKKYEENLQKLKLENNVNFDLFNVSSQRTKNINTHKDIHNNNNNNNNNFDDEENNIQSKQNKEQQDLNKYKTQQQQQQSVNSNINHLNGNTKNTHLDQEQQQQQQQQHLQEMQISEVTTNVQKINVLFKSSPNKKANYQSPNSSEINENNGLLNENCEDDSYLDDLDKNDPFDL